MWKKKQGKGFQWALTLFDSAQFFFEVNIKRGGSHLFLLSLGVSGGSRWAETTNQGDFVVLKILEPRVKSLSWRGDGDETDVLDLKKEHRYQPSGVWNNPFPPTSSLVGLALPETPPGRGEPTVKPAGLLREVGPMDWREFLFSPETFGLGDTLGLGGRREAI